MDAFVVRTKRKAPETPAAPNGFDDGTARSCSKDRVAPKRSRAAPRTLSAPTGDTSSASSPLWSEGVHAGTVWSYVIDALLDNVPPSRIVRVIKTLGALAKVSRLLHDVLHLKRIRIDVLTSISQGEGNDSPSKPITVMCSAVPLALAGVRRKLVFDLFTDTNYDGVSLMVAHGMFTTERHWYRARTGLLCRHTLDKLCKKTAHDGQNTDDDTDDEDVDRVEEGRFLWPKCERTIEMPLSHLLWDEMDWTGKAPWEDDADGKDDDGDHSKDSAGDRKGGGDLKSDAYQNDDHRDGARDEKDDGQSVTHQGAIGDFDGDDGIDNVNDDVDDDDDNEDADQGDDDEDDDDEDRHDDEFGKWVSFADGRWSMCIFHDYRGRMSLYKVSVRL
ncbi:hypothetical protein pmac_cds_264 [Pandoravirus macleodensis]|uniref:Uncharacterized protein n=1 Tax=Pandoravirus macleodensis TaxID=2107707 RepID=A0A2U7UEX8_9VIRU|nr:hypothetical protein pmac_cds_264 [Pandoravirus macleodensis]AVK76952.1 hypothetical protein pmac_cds_264 [Pandoravirus macleodensis]